MDRDQSRFLKNILNTIMRSAINKTLWRLPMWITIAMGVAAAAAMWYFKLL